MNFQQLKARCEALADSPGGKLWLQRAGRCLYFGVLLLLAYQLAQIGWSDIGRSIPSAPLFYLLFLANYATLSLFEALTYRRIWPFRFWRELPVFFKKHVYNQDVLDYSGELYLLVWARRTLGVPEGYAWRSLKDNTILSTLCGYLATLALPAVFLACGALGASQHLSAGQTSALLIGGPLVALASVGLMALLRRQIFLLPGAKLIELGSLHMTRVLLMNAIMVAQWAAVMPDRPLSVWCALLAVSNLVGRLPAVFRGDLVFVAAGVELSQGLGVPAAAMAGMLLANSVLDKVFNAGVMLSLTLLAGKPQPTASLPPGELLDAATPARDAA